MRPFSGANLPAVFLNYCLGFGFPAATLPTGRLTPKQELKNTTGILDPERRLIKKISSQQGDRHSTGIQKPCRKTEAQHVIQGPVRETCSRKKTHQEHGFSICLLNSCLGVSPLGKTFSQWVFFWGEYSGWVFDFLFGCQSSCWEDIFLMRLLSGASLPAVFLNSCLGFGLPAAGGAGIFLLRLLSGAGLPAGFLNYCLGFSLPAGAIPRILILYILDSLQQGLQKADIVDSVDFLEWFAIGHHELLAGFLMRIPSGAGLPSCELLFWL